MKKRSLSNSWRVQHAPRAGQKIGIPNDAPHLLAQETTRRESAKREAALLIDKSKIDLRGGNNSIGQEKQRLLVEAAQQGLSLRAAAKHAGVALNTASQHYGQVKRDGDVDGSPEPYRRKIRPYNRPATRTTINAGFNYLSDLIVRPGIQKRLWPLLLYRGSMTPGQAHRMWNMALLMMASEAETLADGLKLVNNPVFSQLCGPVRTPQKISLCTFFGRLWDNPDTADLIPGLREYVRSLELGPSHLTPVDLETTRAHCAPWRISLHPEPGKERVERGAPQRFYPYMVHDSKRPDEGADLVRLVNAAVPATLPEQWRADVCQEMIIGVLSGDISKGNLHDHVKKYIRSQFKANPTMFEGNMLKFSLDAPLGDDDGDATMHDRLNGEAYDPSMDLEFERDYQDAWDTADRSLAAKDWHYDQLQDRQSALDSYQRFQRPTQLDDVYNLQIRDKQAELQMNGDVLYRDDVIELLEADDA